MGGSGSDWKERSFPPTTGFCSEIRNVRLNIRRCERMMSLRRFFPLHRTVSFERVESYDPTYDLTYIPPTGRMPIANYLLLAVDL